MEKSTGSFFRFFNCHWSSSNTINVYRQWSILCAQLLSHSYANLFETLQVFSSGSENAHTIGLNPEIMFSLTFSSF